MMNINGQKRAAEEAKKLSSSGNVKYEFAVLSEVVANIIRNFCLGTWQRFVPLTPRTVTYEPLAILIIKLKFFPLDDLC